MNRCPECYSEHSRITPLLRPEECLVRHTQYICGTCGRCICIEHDENRGLQRWNFPFRTADIARLYLRTAEETLKKACGIYAITSGNGRVSYKIFDSPEALEEYLAKNKGKTCETGLPVYETKEYHSFPGTQVRRLTAQEAAEYLNQR